jgi:MFS family permease
MVRSDEMQRRYAIFYLLGCVASAFAGILAFGLMHLAGRDHLAGWRWIFIVEGVVSFKAILKPLGLY